MGIPNGYNTIPPFIYLEQIAGLSGAIGTVYYVDGNAGVDTNDGFSWETAFKTIAVALAASHADIAAGAAGWASRNIILVKGDALTENLVLLAQKTDVIGVGSMDWRSKAQLLGNHVIPNTAETHGCRFFNMEFKSPIAGGDIFTITDQHGIEFIGCDFLGNSTTAATAACVATACVDLKFKGCRFFGAFSDAVIEIGAGQADDFTVEDCFIQGANMGIDISVSATYAANKCGIIKNNIISSTLACINDALGTTFVINNRLRTAAAKGSAMAGCIVCGITYAQDNRCTTSDANNVIYPAEGSI
jgi:hypothetical protein